MYCKHPGCKTFKLKCTPQLNETVVHVYNSCLNFNHNPLGLTGYVKGVQWQLFREKLRNTIAFKFNAVAINSANSTQLECGNLQDIKSDDVVRKISSESLMTNDYAQGDLEDLLEISII